ncbi:pyrrolo-quinoline quinone [Acidicapsa ligni]|uniref:pyrrolo-quinoline quinone n=1 Tax=Acidicapsa ligni TaxID=542300 RepID=UPI0021E04144|nr:pyrrolo-quinoline quinone [Acidicapsa ligni]
MKIAASSLSCLLAVGVVLCLNGCGSLNPTFPLAAPAQISVSSTRAALTVSQSYSIAATTKDLSGVTWTATGGGLSADTSMTGKMVTYTAPAKAGIYTVTAANVKTPSQTAAMTVYVTDLGGVYTYHNDLARDGVNSQEYALTTTTVASSSFGKLFSCPVDGAVYTQPLWVANLTIGNAKHNVAFVATQHDSVYAFDADASPCQQLWMASLVDTNHGGSSGETAVNSTLLGQGNGDIAPEVGVTGTPVIDPSTGTLYVVSKSMNSASTLFYQRMHAIDITTGSEKFSGPVDIGANITFPGTGDGGSTVTFNAKQENQRPGLALVNGVVYVAWAAHEDANPFYGWLVGYKASDLTVASILNIDPNVTQGGIWMSGGAPSADANNNLYLISGNGGFDATSTSMPNNDYGDSFLKISNGLTVSSYFTPTDQESDETNDADFGSGGSAVLVNVASGALRHLVIGGGKDGSLYLLNGDSMGGLGDTNARQVISVGSGIFSTGAFWNNTYYVAPLNGSMVAYAFDPFANLLNPSASTRSSNTYGFPGATPSVSASGASNGIVWALNSNSYCTSQSKSCGPAVLHAYDATNLGTELWNSSTTSTDAAGNAVKFTVPTIANGHVYVGTRGNNAGGVDSTTSTPGELDVYGVTTD